MTTPLRLLSVLIPVCALGGPVSSAAGEEDASGGAETYLLRYQFAPGEVLRWDVIHRATIRTTVSGTTQTAESVSKSVKVWKVTDVKPDGSTTFEHSVESVDMRQKLSGRQEVRYNSQTDAEPPPGFQTIAGSIGVPLSIVTMDARGKILLRDRKVPQPTGENDGPMTVPFPEGPLSVGDSWSEAYELDVATDNGAVKKVKTRQTYTLEEVETGIATIKTLTHILTPNLPPEIEAKLIQQESTGTVRFDLDAGRVVGQRIDLDKRVVGFRGDASSLHCVTRFTEKLQPAAATAQRPEAEASDSVEK